MKRDMDMVRDILLYMESSNDFGLTYQEIAEGMDKDLGDVVGHMVMMRSGGLLAESQRGIHQVTWEGHEFIDKVRDPEIWRKTREGASKVGGVGIKLLGDLATAFVKMQIRDRLGIDLQ